MISSKATVVKAPQPPLGTTINQLVIRTRAEYLEMPGLSLTVRQAARLFGLPADVCSATLNSLVESGFLRQNGQTYCRAATGSNTTRFPTTWWPGRPRT
jgi:hypothetical protein